MHASQIKALRSYVDKLKPTLAGRLAFNFLPYRKRIVIINMQRIFDGILSPDQITKLAQGFYSHLLRSIWENLRSRFMSESQLKNQALVRGHEHLINANNAGRGAIVLTGHFGNWEFAPIAGILNFQQYRGRLFFVRKSLKWPWVEQLLFRRYFKAGLGVIPKDNSLEQITESLQANNALFFIMDQHASSGGKNAIVTNFLGYPAATHRALATLVRHLNVPVVPATSYRQPNGQHVLEFFAPLRWQEYPTTRETLVENTRQYNQVLESLLLTHPDQWLWTHKRWKASPGFYDELSRHEKCRHE